MQVFKDFVPGYNDLFYFCVVRQTSCGNTQARFYSFLPEIIEFGNLKKFSLTELKDENYLCDLVFMVDITKYLYNLNAQHIERLVKKKKFQKSHQVKTSISVFYY